MNINITKGSNPQNLTKYLLAKPKSELLFTNMSGRNIGELAAEFRFSHDLNHRVKKNMVHYAVSLPRGERVNQSSAIAISLTLLERMGHYNTQFLIAEHQDRIAVTDCQHWHIAASRVRLDGSCAKDSFDRYRVRHLELALEQEFGLKPTPVRSPSVRRNLTTGEYRFKERTGEKPVKEQLWEAIDTCTQDQPTMALLLTRLKELEVQVEIKPTPSGQLGIVYSKGDRYFSGSQLGAAYSFNGLLKYKGVTFHPQELVEPERQPAPSTTSIPAPIFPIPEESTSPIQKNSIRSSPARQQPLTTAWEASLPTQASAVATLDNLHAWYKCAQLLGKSDSYIKGITEIVKQFKDSLPIDSPILLTMQTDVLEAFSLWKDCALTRKKPSGYLHHIEQLQANFLSGASLSPSWIEAFAKDLKPVLSQKQQRL